MYKFFAYLARMKYIRRWGLMYCNVPENVMEHSHQVAVIAHLLATVSNVYFGGNYDADAIAVKALFHKTGEVVTGDLPTPIKYFNPEISSTYKQVEKIAEDKLLGYLPPELAQVYGEIVADSDPQQKAVVKYADKLCAYLKCVEEVKMGNGEFIRAEKSLRAELDKADDPAVKYFLDNFADAFRLTLDELD